MDWKKIFASAALLASASCGSSKPATTGPAGGVKTSTLWTLAPADTVAGVVVADGALIVGRQWFVEGMRILDARPETKKIADEVRRELGGMPFDPRDDASLSRAGLDLKMGAAIFVNTAEELTVVLPVADRQAFAGLAGGSTTMEGGIEVESFQGGKMRCKMHESRYVCATTAERLAMIGASKTNKLAETAAGLPPAMRGHAELLLDAANYQLGSKLDGIDRYITNAGMMVASATMDRGKLTIRSHLPGTLIGEGKKLAAVPSQLVGKVGSERPSGFLRVRMDPTSLPKPDEVIPGLSLADVVASQTGELLMFAHAGTSGSTAVHVGLRSPDALRKLVGMGCDFAGSMVPFLKIKLEGSACRGSVDLSQVPFEARGLFVQQKVDLDVDVLADRLEFRASMGKKGPVTNAPSPSKLGADLLSGSWNGALWGEGLSPIFLSELVNVGSLLQMGGDDARAMLWIIGHLYEAGIGIGFRDDGVHGLIEVTSFAAASDEEYAGYEAALAKALDGDFAAAASDLDALAKAHAGGIVERQVGMRSSAWIGALGIGGAYLTIGRDQQEAPAAW